MKYNESITVVLPCYNEGVNIYKNVNEIINILDNIYDDIEVICVDDGSIDNTYSELLRARENNGLIKVISYEKNLGKGNAIMMGVRESKNDYIAFLDSDLELSPEYLGLYMKIMKEKNADVVIGSKMHPDSNVDYPFHRKILSIGYYFFLKVLFNLNVKDTQTGLKLFKRKPLDQIINKVLVKKYAFDIEVLAIINNLGYKIVDAPINLVFSRDGVMGRIKFSDIFRVFIDTIAIFYRLNILHYYD